MQALKYAMKSYSNIVMPSLAAFPPLDHTPHHTSIITTQDLRILVKLPSGRSIPGA